MTEQSDFVRRAQRVLGMTDLDLGVLCGRTGCRAVRRWKMATGARDWRPMGDEARRIIDEALAMVAISRPREWALASECQI